MNLAFEQASPDRVVMVLPDQPAFYNHIGGPHAGALFTLGESASGAFVFGHFGDLLDRATSLAVQSAIRYLKVVIGAHSSHRPPHSAGGRNPRRTQCRFAT